MVKSLKLRKTIRRQELAREVDKASCMPSSESTNTTNSTRMEPKLHLKTLRLALLFGATLFLSIANKTNCLNQAEQQAISEQQQQHQQTIGQVINHRAIKDRF